MELARPDPSDHLHDKGLEKIRAVVDGMPSIPPSVCREHNDRIEEVAACRADIARWKALRDELPDTDKFKHRRAALASCMEAGEAMAKALESDSTPGYLAAFAQRKGAMAALDDTDLCPWCGVALAEVNEDYDADDCPNGAVRGRECRNKDCPHDWLDVTTLSAAAVRAEKADARDEVAIENARAARGGGVS